MSVRGLKPDGFLAKTLGPEAIMAAIDDMLNQFKAGPFTTP
jgi:hypothetical protein